MRNLHIHDVIVPRGYLSSVPYRYLILLQVGYFGEETKTINLKPHWGDV